MGAVRDSLEAIVSLSHPSSRPSALLTVRQRSPPVDRLTSSTATTLTKKG